MERITLGRGGVRAGLVLLALPQLAIGVWAIVSPSGWFDTFPGAGRSWLPLYGPFDEHLVTDVGATFLALGVLLVLAAVWMDRRLVIAATVAYLVYQVPHTIFHWANDGVLTDADQVANGIALALSIFLAVGILYASLRRGSDPTPASLHPARIAAPPKTLLARFAKRYSRKRFGRELAPTDAYLHAPGLLAGYGAFEMATERAGRVPESLKLLAELRAAQVVGCEWCMDFGSMLGRAHGVDERQMAELPLFRTSDAFDDLERLVVEYADAMSRTPSEVGDELAARLGERFDDAQLVELTNVIAIENHRARFNHALGLEPQGFSEGAACVVPVSTVAAGERQPRSPDAL